MALDLKKISENYQPPKDEDKACRDLEQQYFALFHERVPREMLPASISEQQIAAALKTCLERKENVLLELLGFKSSDSLIY